jgi:hypothetical protein
VKGGVRPLSLLQLRKDATATTDPVAFEDAQSSHYVDCKEGCTHETNTPLSSYGNEVAPGHHSEVLRHIRFLDSYLEDEPPADTLIMDPKLTVNHNPKCGGTFVRDALSASVADAYIQEEFEPVTMDATSTRATDFVVGMVRNPFSYYVSLWSYNSCVTGRFINALTAEEKSEVLAQEAHCKAWNLGVDADDRVRFRKWLKLVNHPDVGLASMRFYFKYVANSELGVQWGGETAKRCINGEGKCKGNFISADVIADGFHQFDSRKDKICWVETGHLTETTKACLIQFEKEGGHVDWTAFDNSVESGYRNPAPHGKISLFYDHESIQSVLTQDRYLFQYFQFSPLPEG